ncbi:ATP-binding protein [Comamonadaceae bacterium G21597-S1]|nr:ATP-binding protein [Comamonadaceae bacterium G21597-S1]
MTVLVAGAHGVGKTFLAKPSAERLGFRYATASQLIRDERGHATWTETRQVTQIDENQIALARAVARILDGGEQLLLDGHLVLRTRPNELQRLGDSVFRSLRCRRIIILTAPVDVLLSRLKGRGDETWTVGEITAFSEAEIQHGKAVASQLGIEMVILGSPSGDDLDAAVIAAT